MFADDFVAKHKSSHKFDLNKLNKERIAAINFFTHETPFYGALNAALRSTNRADAKHFFAWYFFCCSCCLPTEVSMANIPTKITNCISVRMKLALSGLYCLKLQRTTAYRGVRLDLADQYPKGKKFVNWSFASTTSSLDVLQSEQAR